MKRIYLASAGCLVISAIVGRMAVKPGSRVLFVITAAECEAGDWPWIRADRDAWSEIGMETVDYSIVGKSPAKIARDIDEADILYIAGGNTFYLLEKIQETGCADLIRTAVLQGKPYVGSSAGCVVAGPDIYPTYRRDDVEKAPGLMGYKGLSLVDFVALPHWGNEYNRDFYLNQRLPLAITLPQKYLLLRDDQYIEVLNDFYRIIDSPLFTSA